MRLSVRALADALVLRLNPQLPAGLWLTVGILEEWGGIALVMNSDEGSWGGSGIADLDETADDSEVDYIVRAALDAIQDDVAHASRGMAWPKDPTVAGPLPKPWAKVAGDVLSFGYGSLTFGPGIDLHQIAA
jgi:hypothetical protein